MKLLSTLLLFLSAPAFSAELKVDFAYRDASSSEESVRRLVTLQGSRAEGDAHFDSQCGSAYACDCLLYRTSSDSSPLLGTGLVLSKGNNTFSCRVPGDSADAAKFVQLRARGKSTDVTPLIAIRTSLLLEDVLGPNLEKDSVRGIFRYSCDRTFFEGEGVSANSVACVSNQHLGLITASYNFYTYKSGVDFNSPGGDVAFPADICKRLDFLKVQCSGSAPQLRYGFYRKSVSPFLVQVWMTRAPEMVPGDTQPLTDTYGFAALPDENGSCAPGLVMARPWTAQPASVMPRGPNCPKDGCPSSFLNSGNLNNTAVEISQPAPFEVRRNANVVPCSATGDCTGATFGGAQALQEVRYSALTPKLCVIPPALLVGLF